jgi:hypothetical protein
MRFSKTVLRWTVFVHACILLFLAFAAPVYSQAGFNLILSQPDLTDFPKVALFLEAYDVQGKFIPSMDLNSFKVFEDGFERVVNETRLFETGLHTLVAMNLGATLSNRANASVPTRFEESVFAVASWLNELQSGAVNQYSLTSNEGILVDRLQEKEAFLFQIQNYQPNLFNFQPDFNSLSLALDIAEQPNLIPLSRDSILYITPLPLDQSLDQLTALRARAMDLRVPVNVWLVAPETAANAPAVEQLNLLASSTGGRFFFFSENAQSPDPEEYVGQLRNLYELVYTSNVSQSGAHTIAVEGFYGNQTYRTPDLQFSINLNLPTAVLVELPDEIIRSYASSAEGRVLQPGFITLTAEYLFPDGYDRQLRSTRLYVDGEVVDENKEAPFEFFAWPLDRYQFGGEHLLSVEVEDILGFRSISPPVSVWITVESMYPPWLTGTLKFLTSGGWIPAAIILVGGTVAAGLRYRRRLLSVSPDSSERYASEDYIDPLQQSVAGVDESTDNDAESGTLRDQYPQGANEIRPKLIWAGEVSSPIPGNSIVITDQQVIIGSDAEQCEIVISSMSISPKHAVLIRSEGGAVRLADLGSESGTWVNFAPVSSKGTILNHGDIVQIGKLSFRYQIGGYREEKYAG